MIILATCALSSNTPANWPRTTRPDRNQAGRVHRRDRRVIKKAMAKGLINKADPLLTAYSLFAIGNWPYQWYRPDQRSRSGGARGTVLANLSARSRCTLSRRPAEISRIRRAPASCASRHAAIANGRTSAAHVTGIAGSSVAARGTLRHALQNRRHAEQVERPVKWQDLDRPRVRHVQRISRRILPRPVHRAPSGRWSRSVPLKSMPSGRYQSMRW